MLSVAAARSLEPLLEGQGAGPRQEHQSAACGEAVEDDTAALAQLDTTAANAAEQDQLEHYEQACFPHTPTGEVERYETLAQQQRAQCETVAAWPT